MIPVLLKQDFYEVVGVASRSYSKAKVFGEKFQIKFYSDYDSLLSLQPDAIYIPTPNSLRFEWVKTALEKGIHVLAEKPMSCTLDEAREVNELAFKNDLVLLENFQFRFHAQLNFIEQKISEGAIGELRNLRASFGIPPFDDKNNIRYSKSLGGGALLDVGVYPIKVSQIFLGHDIYVSSAALSRVSGKEVDIWGSAFLKQKHGHVTSQIAFGFDNYYQNTLDLWGSNGHISASRIFTAGPGVKARLSVETKTTKKELLLCSDNHFKNMLEHFYRLIAKLESRECEYTQNINQARLVDEVREKSGC